MTANDSGATAVAAAVCEGLATAQRVGAPSVAAHHLASEQLESLITATLAHLRSVPGKPSDREGWTTVTSRAAAVMTWWATAAGLTDSERRRLSTLRRDVYATLAERDLIVLGEGRSTSVQVSPVQEAPDLEETVEVPEVEVLEIDTPAIEDAPSGAWVLKLSPYVYDTSRVFGAWDGRVYAWSVEDDERSARMQYGDRVYLWMGEGDLYREAGVWGVGYVAGPTVLGAADDGWLDHEAASQANVFAVVDISLLYLPVSRATFLGDARLAETEVIRDPYAPNPGLLTTSEAAALEEYLEPVAVTAERVA